MKKLNPLIIILFLIFISPEIYLTCTTGVFSGKSTPDGRPLLWKHRDTGFSQNKILFFDDGKYDYIGLINSADSLGKEVWIGYNSTGFAIMNSASYNLKEEDDTTSLADREGVVMKKALQECSSLKEFEELLKELSKPLGVEANFGVIDGNGGAAYYEVNNFSFTKLDVNDTTLAPDGYMLHTNFSFNGREDEGYGYIRYATAEMLFDQAYEKNKITPQFIIQNVSRSLYHSLTKENIESSNNEFEFFQDFIPRYYSTASVVVQGVNPEIENDFSTMWTVLGFPLTSVAVPIWLESGNDFPQILTAEPGENAGLADFSLKMKDKAFPVKRGSGDKYIKINELYNSSGTGITQKILPLENQIFEESYEKIQKWRTDGIDIEEVKNFNKYLNKLIPEYLENHLNYK